MMKSKEPSREPDAPIPAQATDDATEHRIDSEQHEAHVPSNDQADHPDGVVRKEGMLKTLIKNRSLSKKTKDKEDKATAIDSQPENTTKKEHEASGTSKLKAWIKRKLLHRKVKIVWEMEDEVDCAVGREVKRQFVAPRVLEEYWQTYEMNSHHMSQTFPAVGRDLQAIGRRLSSVDGCIIACQQALLRTDRIIRSALQKRKAFLETMRAQAEETTFKDLFVRPPDTLEVPQQRSRTKSFGTMDSRVSVASCFTTICLATEGDDDDTRLLRRLFRKTEARLCGAWDQIDQVMIWLRIVKEILRGVKREAYI